MSVGKVIEVSSASSQSFEDAIEKGLAKAAESVHGIQGAWIKEQKVRTDGAGKVAEYRVSMSVTFRVD